MTRKKLATETNGPSGVSFSEMPGFSPDHSTIPGKLIASAMLCSCCSADSIGCDRRRKLGCRCASIGCDRRRKLGCRCAKRRGHELGVHVLGDFGELAA